jgi:hypothetical protein
VRPCDARSAGAHRARREAAGPVRPCEARGVCPRGAGAHNARQEVQGHAARGGSVPSNRTNVRSIALIYTTIKVLPYEHGEINFGKRLRSLRKKLKTKVILLFVFCT